MNIVLIIVSCQNKYMKCCLENQKLSKKKDKRKTNLYLKLGKNVFVFLNNE